MTTLAIDQECCRVRTHSDEEYMFRRRWIFINMGYIRTQECYIKTLTLTEPHYAPTHSEVKILKIVYTYKFQIAYNSLPFMQLAIQIPIYTLH